jgi:hypothetical protein
LIYFFIFGFILLLWLLGIKQLGERILPYTLTLRELIITVSCSFFPIILDSIIQGWFTTVTLSDAFFTSFENGQAFLYTSAYLAAFFVFYIKGNDKPPGFILGIVFYSGFAGALLYTFAYSTEVLQLQSYAPKEVITSIEISIVFCVFIAWYWSTLPSNKSSSTGAKVAQKQQDKLEASFNNIKGVL